MENNPTAPGDAPAPQSEATPTTNTESTQAPVQTQAPAPAPDMHGFTSEQLADIQKFFDANGGFDKVKSKISNPQPAQAQAPETQQTNEPTSQQQAKPVEQPYQRPKGALTNDELMAQYYFETLSKREEYAPISKEIANGDVLTEMSRLGIPFRNEDGSWNGDKIKDYLDLRAKTVPAKSTSTEPNASNAPTVEYIPVEDGKVTTADQAYKILQQDAQLKAMGQAGHPNIGLAEEFIKSQLNPGQKNTTK